MGSRIVRKALQIGMSQTRNLDGVFAVHKPANITSADVLRDLQKQFNPSKFFQPWIDGERARRRQESKFQQRRRRDKRLEVKLGHGGTLDPMATGVLITGVGKGTKSLNNFLKCTKTYETVVLFGVATDSYDRVGKLVSRAPYEHVTREMVEKALEQFRGKIMQRPSIFSALKVQGKKLYEYAREGIEPPVEILKRPVEVSNLEIMEWYEPGTHDYVWPTEEASENEKSIALKMRAKDLGTTTSAETETGERPLTSHAEEHGQKRKTPPAEEPRDSKSAEQPSSSPKRQKTVPEEISTDESLLTSDTPAEPSAESPPKPPAVKLTMTVSSGFYVRSLAHDLGLALNSNAIMSSLVRSRQGDFDLAPEHVLEYKDLEGGEDVWGPKLQGFLDDWAQKRPSNESDKSDVDEGIKDTRNEKEG